MQEHPTQPKHDGMQHMHDPAMQKTMYRTFLAMVGTSTAVMFALMYVNTFAAGHVLFSQTRMWMAFVMGAVMGALMLAFMRGMYKNAKWNALIYLGCAVVFAVALWLLRSQQTVDDVAYMRAMVPHHSIAIMTSERAHLRDPRVRRLAKGIIDAQRREIAEMKYLIDDIDAHGVRTATNPEAAP